MNTWIIGRQIANVRKERGMSQLELAEMLFVTPQAVSKWERGESLPDIFMLAKISDIFDIYDIGFFLGKEPLPCGSFECDNLKLEGGGRMNPEKDFTTIEQFVEFWQSCSLKGLQKIAAQYGVEFEESDSKDVLVTKLTDGMNQYCENNKEQ